MSMIDILKSLPIGFYVMFCLFFVCSIVELILAFKEKEKLRRIIKPFLMLFLSIATAIAIPNHPLVVIALVCGLLGDILVVLKFKHSFVFGVLSFFAGHILYVIEIIGVALKGNLSIGQILMLIFVFVVVLISTFMLIFRKIADKKILGMGMSLYFGALLCVLPTMIIATSKLSPYFAFAIVGSVFFIISDSLLMYFKYGRTVKRHHFYIMSTYLIAQALIAIGFVLSYTSLVV